MTEIRFVGNEFEGAADQLDGLAAKLRNLANNAAMAKFGKSFLPNPTDIEILPTTTTEVVETTFIMRAWHELESSAGSKGILQAFDTSFDITIEGEDAFMRTEEQHAYPITTREFLLLMTLSNMAVATSLLSSHNNLDDDSY